nr:chaperone protein DnaJ 49 [Tanacetum cinerariifolium]
MDGNKDDAVKCVDIAKEAIASGNKARAMKFIGMAQRLNHNLDVNDLLVACKNLDSANRGPSNGTMNHVGSKYVCSTKAEGNGEVNYTKENVQLVRKIKRNTDYYEILGVEKTCTGEEIKNAYRKISLKVHPDKNKAPGSEEAFKKVGKAFKCLSDEGSRRQYDHTDVAEGDEYNQQNNVRRQRNTARSTFEDEDEGDFVYLVIFTVGVYLLLRYA